MPHPLLVLVPLLLFPPRDTITALSLPRGPLLDGRADEREYGAPGLRLATAAGDVRVWVGRHGGFLYIAAVLPDSTFFWGDDFVVSLDRDGSGGTAPGDGDRQWYLRRLLDSSVVATAANGRWAAPGQDPPMLGATRHHAEWDVASTSGVTEWIVELRIREEILTGFPRLAFRTYNDAPAGWWSLPQPPSGTPAQRVERNPDAWAPVRLGRE